MNRRNFIASLLATGAVPMLARAELPDLTDLYIDVGPELDNAVTDVYTTFDGIDWALVKTEANKAYRVELQLFQSSVGRSGSSLTDGSAKQGGSFDMTRDMVRRTKNFEQALGSQLGKMALAGQVSFQIGESAGNDLGVVCVHSADCQEMDLAGTYVAGGTASSGRIINDHPSLIGESKSIHFKLARSLSPVFHVTTKLDLIHIMHKIQFEA